MTIEKVIKIAADRAEIPEEAVTLGIIEIYAPEFLDFSRDYFNWSEKV